MENAYKYQLLSTENKNEDKLSSEISSLNYNEPKPASKTTLNSYEIGDTSAYKKGPGTRRSAIVNIPGSLSQKESLISSEENNQNADLENSETISGLDSLVLRIDFPSNTTIKSSTNCIKLGSDQKYDQLSPVGNFCNDYIRLIEVMSLSPFVLPLYFLLTMFSISAIYMGTAYMEACPSSTPSFLIIIGLCGVICLISRMIDMAQPWLFPHSPKAFPSHLCFFTFVTILLLFIIEIMVALRIKPEFDSRKSNYCNPVFYNFLYYGNFIGFTFILIFIILYLPRLVDQKNSSPGYTCEFKNKYLNF